MTQLLPPEKLRQTWDTLVRQVGQYQKQMIAREEKIQGYDVIYVTCEFEKTNLGVKVVFDKDRKIAGLFFVPTK